MKARGAFTLVELMVTIVIIAILAAILLPVLSHSKQSAQGTYCLNNGHQMMVAMTLYGTDYHGFFPPNPDDGNTIPEHNWVSGNAGVGGSAEFNPDLLLDQSRSLLVAYLSGNITVFHCPADMRMGPYQGTNTSLIGQTIPAVRTFSMNQAVGTICTGYDQHERGENPPSNHIGAPNLAVNGPWLNNKRTNVRDDPWITYGTFQDIRTPGPGMLWVLVDENVNNLNDAAFAFGMQEPQWIDSPGTYHNGGCGFAYVDGHSESHQWRSTEEKGKEGDEVVSQDDYQDYLWMWVRTSANATGTNHPPPSPF